MKKKIVFREQVSATVKAQYFNLVKNIYPAILVLFREKEGKQMKKIIILLLTFAMCLSICACGEKIPQEVIDAYNNANASFSQGRYEEAAKFYVEAGDYEDTQQKLLEIYYHAVNCFENSNYEQAFSLFSILAEANVNDSAVYKENLKNIFSYIDAIRNAEIQLYENSDPIAAYEYLIIADEYANDEQKREIVSIKKTLFFESTHIPKADFFFSGSPITTKLNEDITVYSYRYTEKTNSGEISRTAKYSNYLGKNLTQKYYETAPTWLSDITDSKRYSTLYIDNEGNGITFVNTVSFSGSKTQNYIKIYVFSPDFIAKNL